MVVVGARLIAIPPTARGSFRFKVHRTLPGLGRIAQESALRKYFQNVINARWSIKKMPRPQKERTLPEILSQKEVVKLIECAPTFKHQVFLTFIYGTGLRLSEALNITFQDIDGDRLQIKVSRGKGAKDRVVQISECLLQLLRCYYRRLKLVNYLFNGLKAGSRYSNRAAQWSIIRARELAGIKKAASIHTLRNCYATHHIENGTDLVFLQEQLGHKHLKTTARYVAFHPLHTVPSLQGPPDLARHGPDRPGMHGTLSPNRPSDCTNGNKVPLDYSIGDLFRSYGERYIRIYKPNEQRIKLIRAIRVCKTQALEVKFWFVSSPDYLIYETPPDHSWILRFIVLPPNKASPYVPVI